ncbi:MAG: DUF4292 domain-containing protein [Crocinitomicaceae bacterium]|nr:DUF4292 domain-containing protein [Crocinitomicaceae bacterium]
MMKKKSSLSHFILFVKAGLYKIYYYTIFFCVAILFLSSCRTSKKAIEERDPLRNHSSGYLLKQYEKNEFNYQWLRMKVDVNVKTPNEATGFKANIRMKSDSVIWISVTPLLGIEVFRILITKDSVKYISRIPENKYYYTGGFSSVSNVAKIDLDFNMLQDLLIGNAVGLDKEEGRFRSEIDNDKYLLISKYKRRIRKVVGVDDRKLNPNDSIVVHPNDPRYQRAVKKSEDEDLIVSRYWLEPNNFRLVKCIFNDLFNLRTVQIEYDGFEQHEEQFFPKNSRLFVKDPKGEQEISFHIIRIATDETFDFPYEIPEDFERKLNP